MALVTTVGGETSNSYVSAADADTYWANHYDATKAARWAALTTGAKETVLQHACFTLEGIRCTVKYTPVSSMGSYEYSPQLGVVIERLDDSKHPVRYNYFQRLQFPRNLDVAPTTGVAYVPDAVKMAQYEQAMFLLTLDDAAIASQAQGVKSESVKVGPVAVSQTFAASAANTFAPTAMELLRPYFVKSSVRLLRG